MSQDYPVSLSLSFLYSSYLSDVTPDSRHPTISVSLTLNIHIGATVSGRDLPVEAVLVLSYNMDHATKQGHVNLQFCTLQINRP